MKLIPDTIPLLPLILPLLILSAQSCQSLREQEKPMIKVSDQPLDSNMLIIDEVFSPTAGWVIIHKELNGQAGPMIGFCKVAAGLNRQVQVKINPEQATLTLYASLHADAGITDTLEFPGNDVPVKINGRTVMAAFQIK